MGCGAKDTSIGLAAPGNVFRHACQSAGNGSPSVGFGQAVIGFDTIVGK